MHNDRSPDGLTSGMDACHARACAAHRDLLRLIARADRAEHWRGSGARDMAHWLWMRYGVSDWKARRWIAAAHALESLPRVSEALASGELGIDKVVELTRFATPETEARLVPWARGISCGAIRRRADVAARQDRIEAEGTERARFASWWWFDGGRRFGLEAELPAAQGAIVERALARLAGQIPVMPGEEGPDGAEARRADALVTLASARLASDPDPDRAAVVVHASAEALASDDRGCEIGSGGVIHPATARRLLCNARVQAMVEDDSGQLVRMGRMTREPPAWMVRQLRHRDQGCTFPGCGTRSFTHAHHVVWWERGGPTDLENLVLVCSFHHRLVHEYGWHLRRLPDGEVRWFRPDGSGYRAGPAPPEKRSA